jgi:hypothetical protein
MSGRLIRFRPVRSAPNPLGFTGRNDQRDLLNLIAAGDAGCFGLALDPTLVGSQKEIRDRALAQRLSSAVMGNVTLIGRQTGTS